MMTGRKEFEMLANVQAANALYQARYVAERFAQVKEAFPEGFTLNIAGNVVYEGGYVVGVRSFETAFDAAHWVAANYPSNESNVGIGYWVDDDGKEYIDAVVIVQRKTLALRIARAHKQIAIYDLDSKTTIYVADEPEPISF
jgi:hypothetical protein